jgi:molecular chaperone GrpE
MTDEQKQSEITEVEDYKDKYLRALADYDNLKKETAKEKSAMGDFARSMAAMEFIGVYDNLKKALRQDYTNAPGATNDTNKQLENWKLGLGHILNQFAGVLKDLGVEEIKTVGEDFDPQKHEAVGHETADGVVPDVIIKEIEGGYQMGERVVKAAKVIVSK